MSKYSVPESFFPHQKADWERLMNTTDSFMNLSEMGTGKTPTAIGLAHCYGFAKILIVCPKTLRLEWRRQILDWTDIDPAVSKKGCYRRLEPLFYDMMGKTEFNPYFIVNYETFRTTRHLDVLKKYPFDLVILDEAHRLRKPSRGQTRGMREFMEYHPDTRVLALTGSPIVNFPGDLHTLLCLVRPEEYEWDDHSTFENRYSVFTRTRVGRCRKCRHLQVPFEKYKCPKCGSEDIRIFRTKRVAGSQNLEELRQLTDPFTIRHTKKEVLPWLPEKYYRRVSLDMGSEQRQVYNQMERELFVRLENGEDLFAPENFARLMRLRQLCIEPRMIGVKAPSIKTEFLMSLIRDLGGRKLVIYSTFEKYLLYLHITQDLPEHIMITGETPSDNRVPMAQRFCEDDRIQLCLASIGPQSPGGEGITLTGASDVIFLDRWWTPASNHQAEDRLHRITQKNAVQVIIPTADNSIDQSFDRILEKKEMLIGEFFGDEKSVQAEIIADRWEAIKKGQSAEIDLDDEDSSSDEKEEEDDEPDSE